MDQPQEKNIKPDLDTQILSDFIYDLNIARRQLSLYPPKHPQIISSSNTVLKILNKLCQFRAEITLGIAPEALIFEQNWLDEKNPVYRDFARFLSSLDIASISFHAGLETTELIQFNQILRQEKQAQENAGGIPALLEQRQIKNITVIPIDYGAFQASTGEQQADKNSANMLWDDFLQGLLSGQLDQEGKVVGSKERIDPALVAEILNQTTEKSPGKVIDYDQVISSFIAKTQRTESQNNADIGEQLGILAKNLSPDLKRSFLNSTFRALDQHPETSATILGSLPQEIISEALQQKNSEQLNISSRLIDLLGQFSTTARGNNVHNVTGAGRHLSDEMLKSRIEILLLEDNHDAYIPSDYQKTLDKILVGKVKGTVPPQTAHILKQNMEKQSVERQCCAIIFNMLRNQVDRDVEGLIQENLTELSRFFLETGDFQSLQEIFIRWSQYLYGGISSARFLDENVLADHTRESFMNEVLDSIEMWGKEKYDEICSYISEIGEPYAELLIERLGNDEQMTRRKTWMRLLVELGSKGHQIIIKTLQDKRWYLVRNLLIVLGRQKGVLPMKAVHQLTTHPHPKVRQEALRILFRYNPATANRLLLKELSSGNKETLAAMIPLAELSQDVKILHQLHHLLQSEVLNDEDLILKKLLLDSLAFLGKPESIPVLAKLLSKKGLLRTRRQKDLHLEIIKRLGAYPPQASGPLLNAVINKRDRTQSQLAKAQLQLHSHAGGQR
ncbi:MAG: hypothetical protein OQK50_04165 [Deltaproteobacteria bacterium]|nr:hypothetical protein [Deltaproteobacteria bacterium]